MLNCFYKIQTVLTLYDSTGMLGSVLAARLLQFPNAVGY